MFPHQTDQATLILAVATFLTPTLIDGENFPLLVDADMEPDPDGHWFKSGDGYVHAQRIGETIPRFRIRSTNAERVAREATKYAVALITEAELAAAAHQPENGDA